jgi:hypothetical protein
LCGSSCFLHEVGSAAVPSLHPYQHGTSGNTAMVFSATKRILLQLKKSKASSLTFDKNSRRADANYYKETHTYFVEPWTNSFAGMYHNYGTGLNKSKRHKQDNATAYKLHGHQSKVYYYAGCEGKHGLWQNTELLQPRKPNKQAHGKLLQHTTHPHGTQLVPSRCTSDNSNMEEAQLF